MYQIITGKHQIETEYIKGQLVLNGKPVDLDLIEISENRFHIIHENHSYLAEVLNVNYAEKTFSIKINNGIYDLEITDPYDALLKNLGMDSANANKPKDIKAPMPGLVLEVFIAEGNEVKKGDNLLVLEAMKMENVIKSQSDFKVRKITVKAGDKVAKNQIMLTLE